MSKPRVIKYIELSNYTAPGRLGYNYAIELDFGLYQKYYDELPKRHHRRFAYTNLMKELVKRWGKPYQKHWRRNQKNRRWYAYELSSPRRARVCFKTDNDRMFAGMLYENAKTR